MNTFPIEDKIDVFIIEYTDTTTDVFMSWHLSKVGLQLVFIARTDRNFVTLSSSGAAPLRDEFIAHREEYNSLKAKLSRHQRGSKNYGCTLHQLRRLNEHWTNVSTDM